MDDIDVNRHRDPFLAGRYDPAANMRYPTRKSRRGTLFTALWLAQMVLLFFKLGAVIDWSWWIVLAPSIAMVGLPLAFVALGLTAVVALGFVLSVCGSGPRR